MSDRTPEQRAADRREIEKLHPGERFQMMMDMPTPETDAEADLAHNVALDWDSRDSVDEKPVAVHVDFARRLERERDEKIADIQKAADEIDRWRKLARRENERALSLEEECNGLRARVAELERALGEMTKSRDAVLQRLMEKVK